jgi:hypothetical protein
MSRSRLPLLVSLGTAGAFLLAACNGHVLSLGDGTTVSQVEPSAVSGAVSACDATSAHPNVCCTAGPNEAATCLVYPNAPFTPCAAGATTYPDPRSCCPLNGSGPCQESPPSGGGSSSSSGGISGGGGGSGGGVSSGGSGGCANVCPPGWYAPAGSHNECCYNSPDGMGGACTGWGGSSGGGCACAPCPPNGPCAPCMCPPPTAPECPACPPGWQVPEGDPNQCCTTEASGEIECFSQAGISEPPDAGSSPPTGYACGGSGPGPDGGLGACSCQTTANGHSYQVDCEPTTNTCTCTTDGAVTTSFPANGHTCMGSDPASLFTMCGVSGG